MNKKILRNVSYTDTTYLKRLQLNFEEVLNGQIFKWRENANRNYIQV